MSRQESPNLSVGGFKGYISDSHWDFKFHSSHTGVSSHLYMKSKSGDPEEVQNLPVIGPFSLLVRGHGQKTRGCECRM